MNAWKHCCIEMIMILEKADYSWIDTWFEIDCSAQHYELKLKIRLFDSSAWWNEISS